MSSTTNVIVIDDDANYRKLLELRLKSFLTNLNLVQFEDLETAKSFLESEQLKAFDLVILDEHLPDGKGVDLLKAGYFQEQAVVTISSDPDVQVVGNALKAGSLYFLSKTQISDELFPHLIKALMARAKLVKELNSNRIQAAILDTVKTLVATLRHEINNPLGAVLGATFLLKNNSSSSPEQVKAASLIESSGTRIKEVLEKLCDTLNLRVVEKSGQNTFHIEGDKEWVSNQKEK